jgi:hypothetical protein
MNTVLQFKRATPAELQRKADKVIGDYAARMWLAGVDIHIIDLRLKPQKRQPERQSRVAA